MEIKTIRNYWGRYPQHNYYHYYKYRLYMKNISEDELLDYIPPFTFYNIYWEKRHTGLDRSCFESKVIQHQIFMKYNIPSIDILAMVKRGILMDMNNHQITFFELCEQYLKNEKGKLFIKPEYGRGGHGIFVLSKNNGIVFLNNKPVSIDGIVSALSKEEDYLIQEGFVQSKNMNEISSQSVNTLRLCTQLKDNEIIVPYCLLRTGVDNNFVDNFDQGGLIVTMDTKDGTLADYGQTKDTDRRYYEHPTSHFVFKNSKIENWTEIKSQVVKYASFLTEWKDIGWDVAIGDEGIKILEINVQYGLGMQLIYGGMRKMLGIYPEDLRNCL